MSWVEKGDRALIEAIVSSFSESPESSVHRLSRFKAKDWIQTQAWLDTSCLSFYFLKHVHDAGIASAVDETVLRTLEQKLVDNKERTAVMMQEFVSLNLAFRAAGISYANLKGFTLAPDSCPDLSMRYQSDYDFLIDPAHMQQARGLLEERGYTLTGSTPGTLEFKCGSAQKISLEGRYKAPLVRSIELHVSVDSKGVDGAAVRDLRLDRLRDWSCDAGTFPALSSADQLIGQALHLLGHLRTEHTRPSWFLEYRNHVLARKGDSFFWREAFTLSATEPDARIALGLSTLLATELFGEFSFPELDAWTLDALPPQVRLWAETFGRKAVLADVPGTKLHLILNAALNSAPSTRRSLRHALKLIPVSLPARILRPPPQDNLRLRIRREIYQLQYILHRLRFHLEQGVLHAIAMRRWNRLLRDKGLVGLSSREQIISDDDKTKMSA